MLTFVLGGLTMSRYSRFVWFAAVAGAFVATVSCANAGEKARTRVAWGYDALPGKDDACASTCFSNKGNTDIYHLGTGQYKVQMYRAYAPDPSNLQVSSAENPTLAYCAIAGWSNVRGKTVDALVDCYDINGNPADTYFTYLYQSRSKPFGSSEKGIAFLWADQPMEASYTPNLDYQYNSAGATITMVRNGTGSYTASIPGLTKKGGNVQVTAYGGGAARCKVSSWSASQSGTGVNVLCFDSAGAAADQMFTLAYTLGEPLGLFRSKQFGHAGAYAWANKPREADVYTPPHAYNYSAFKTGPLTAQKNRTGEYTLNIPDKTQLESNSSVLVTAYGTTNSFCTAGDGLEFWEPLQVFCYDQNGDPSDSKFSVVIQTNL